jgi:hypothetical protein
MAAWWPGLTRTELNSHAYRPRLRTLRQESFNLYEGHETHSRISCMACGHEIGTVLELKDRVAEEVLKHAAARDAAKGGKTARP